MVIWGTGNVCNHILKSNLEIIPEFFIDNDINKTNSEIYGKRVLHPSQIQDWYALYIVVAVDNYMPIKAQLEENGLKEKQQFVWYRDFLFEKSLPEILKEADEFLGFLQQKAAFYHGKSVIFSDFLAFDKGVCDFVNTCQIEGLDAILLSEAYWIGDNYAEKKLNIPVCRLPAVLSHNQYLSGKILIDSNIIHYVENSISLKEASTNLRMGYSKMAEGYEYIVSYWADRIVRAMIEYWEPKEVMVWNAFYAFHIIVRSICEEKNVPVKYMEFGNIPGTIQVETLGQMGESYPARFPKEFLEINVSEEEYREVEELIADLCKKRLNRNVQPKNQLLDHVKQKLMKDRPVILYAGQNDNAAGLQPYTEKSKKYHSPIFESSDDAAIYLAELCRKNNWNYIYKPHPMMMEDFVKERIPQNTILVNNVDINDLIDMADVLVTILSTVSYIALIRTKPVLMLGYTQLKGKGCTYEVFEREYIEEHLLKALNHKRTEAMRKKFIKHVVQLKKYYIEKADSK